MAKAKPICNLIEQDGNILIAVVMFLPNVISAFEANDTESPSTDDLPTMLVYAEDTALASLVKEYFTPAFVGYNVKVAQNGLDAIKVSEKQRSKKYKHKRKGERINE